MLSRPGGAKEILLRPSGAVPQDLPFHELRCARLAAGCAPLVATSRGPVGAEESDTGSCVAPPAATPRGPVGAEESDTAASGL